MIRRPARSPPATRSGARVAEPIAQPDLAGAEEDAGAAEDDGAVGTADAAALAVTAGAALALTTADGAALGAADGAADGAALGVAVGAALGSQWAPPWWRDPGAVGFITRCEPAGHEGMTSAAATPLSKRPPKTMSPPVTIASALIMRAIYIAAVSCSIA
jgi:hypothetical protein